MSKLMCIAAVLLPLATACVAGSDSELSHDRADGVPPMTVLAPVYGLVLDTALELQTTSGKDCESGCQESYRIQTVAAVQVEQDGFTATMQAHLCRGSFVNADGKEYEDGDVLDKDYTLSALAQTAFTATVSDDQFYAESVKLEIAPNGEDVDNDGKDGLSLHVAVGRVFVRASLELELAGEITSAGDIAGSALVHRADWEVLGDTIWVANAAKRAAEFVSKTTISSQTHTMEMFAMEESADGIDCAAVVAAAQAAPPADQESAE